MKNEPFKITEEIINNANSYIPLAEKIATAKIYADNCVVPVEVSITKIEANEFLNLPQLWEDDNYMKEIYLLQFFLKKYLKIDIKNDFDSNEYDKYAKDFPMNQMERFKTNPNVKDKVFDILQDFKKFKKIFDSEMFNLKSNKNNSLERFMASITLLSSPENVGAMTKQLVDVMKEVEKFQAEKKKTTVKKVETSKKQTQESNAKTKEFVESKGK